MSNNNIDYLNLEDKSWCNYTGYGNMQFVTMQHETNNAKVSIAQWDRIEPLKEPYIKTMNTNAWTRKSATLKEIN